MFLYIYDGSFSGLLTAIYEAYYHKDKPEEIIPEEKYQPHLLACPIYIQTDEVKSSKVSQAIHEKIGRQTLHDVYCTFLSELPGSSTLIYEYLKLGFKLKDQVNLHLHLDSVRQVLEISQKVGAEQHRMLGFVRFSLIENKFYYAAFEPDYNILELIAPHFATRLANEYFIIHDVKRELAVFYNTNEWVIGTLAKEQFSALKNHHADSSYQTLWKEYFQATTITSRLNPKCQIRSMPKRYWTYLTEMN